MAAPRVMPLLIAVMLGAFPPIDSRAHQPVMDMAPRWNGGYGFQVRAEHLVRDNALGERVETTSTWLEGVYTIRRAHRVTFKLPYVVAQQRSLYGGAFQERTASGWGDLILGFQNKAYFNKTRSTGNVSLTPSLRLPTGSTAGEVPLGQGAVGYGVSLSASVEMFHLYTLFDAFGWRNTEGNNGVTKGTTLGFDIDLGVHPYHNMAGNYGLFLMSGINGRSVAKDHLPTGMFAPNSGGRTLDITPTIVLYRQNLMFRAQYALPVVRDMNGSQLKPSPGFQAGIGVVFPSRSPF